MMALLPKNQLRIRNLGLVDYLPTWQNMKHFVDNRSASTVDEYWLLQHPPVFTLGQAADKEHLLAPGEIPVIQTDRGGQVTYHGPGQLIIYVMVDIKRSGMGPRALVTAMETSVIELLSGYGIIAEADPKAPGVYVGGKKIASLGLRIRRGNSFHGLSLNVDMDLEPFTRINPCGYEGLQVTQMSALGVTDNLDQLAVKLSGIMAKISGYNEIESLHEPYKTEAI